METSNHFFKTFANCIVVEGINRSLICDLGRSDFKFIPNDMLTVINELDSRKSIKDVISQYGESNEQIIKEYIDFLILNEYGHYLENEEYDLFPKMSTDFKTPCDITNSIVEIRKNNITVLEGVIANLSELQCEGLVIIFYEIIDIKIINKILSYFSNSSIYHLEIISYFSSYYTNIDLKKIDTDNPLIKLTFTGAKNNQSLIPNEIHCFMVNYLENEVSSHKFCGTVNSNNFNTVQDHFLESQNHNSCLNKKLSIDIDGNIKNCPSMQQTFGNIKDTTLEEALGQDDFKKYWNITKNQIDVCKDCEFRYICTDCRAYVEDPEDMYSKPLKCGYSPYTNKWEEWSTNPLKERAIEFYGMQDLVKKDA